MKRLRFPYICLALLTAVAIVGFSLTPGQAVQLMDGTVHFVQPPQLVTATSTFSTVNSTAATYFFTVTVPPTAGESLQRITFAQASGSEIIPFQPQASEAFEGERSHLGAKVPLADVTKDPQTQAISVTFEPSIAPGKTVTVALYPSRNPSVRGPYFIGVTAFPAGSKPYGQFLGYGRFQIRSTWGV